MSPARIGPVFRQHDVAEAVRQGIISRIAEQLGVAAEEITLDTKLLGAESLDTAELIMKLEEEFGLDFGDAFPE